MTKELTIDFETADKITVLNLKDAYTYLQKEIEEIRTLDEIPDHKAADMCYNVRMVKHIREVLSYFGETV